MPVFVSILPEKMSSPRALPTEGPSAGGGDEFDDLFNYEVGGEDDPFSENYKVPNKVPAAKENTSKGKSGAGLGIDEEVEVARKPRAPRVKLDENRYIFMVLIFDSTNKSPRLLSAAGIPKLRKRAKTHLKFKGKGHEVLAEILIFLYIADTVLVLRHLQTPRLLPTLAR